MTMEPSGHTSCGVELSGLLFFLLEFRLSRRLPTNHEVSPVLSLPFYVSVDDYCKDASASDEKHDVLMELQQACNDCHAACIRRVVVGDRVASYALESPGFFGIAGKVWDSMYVLLRFLALPQSRSQYVEHKRIIELGSGTGLAGALIR